MSRQIHGKVSICYNIKGDHVKGNKSEYENKKKIALQSNIINSFIIPKKSGRAWKMKKDDLCRVSIIEGSQVGDLNMWNLHNPEEHFYSGKTRQLHASHLSVFDRLWSNFPNLRPMATVVGDSVNYGIDEDGGSLHDVIGTRCDGYTYKLITGKESSTSCHSQLTAAIAEFGLKEKDVHDVWNIFMCTGFTKDTHQYFCKPCPCRAGDYIEFIADMDLLVAVSTCPQGDVSIPVGEPVPDSVCFPLKVEIFSPE